VLVAQDEVSEDWSTGVPGFKSITPLFHHSSIPVFQFSLAHLSNDPRKSIAARRYPL
jgi:hypothetical protein